MLADSLLAFSLWDFFKLPPSWQTVFFLVLGLLTIFPPIVVSVPLVQRNRLWFVIAGVINFIIATGLHFAMHPSGWNWFKDLWLTFFAHWLTQDILLVVGLGLIVTMLVRGARSERWSRAWTRLKRDRTGLVALSVVSLYIFIGALETFRLPTGDHGAPQSLLDLMFQGLKDERSYSAPLADRLLNDTKPTPDPMNSSMHLMGTDSLGKDVFLQTLKGCRTALFIGGLTSVIYIPVGVLLGICAGYFRKWVDDVIQYLYSVLASIPEILLLVSILFVLGPGLGTISIALGTTGWVGLCRLIRGETMRQSERSYVTAARSLGQTHWQIITRHLLPNVMHLVLINFVLGFSSFVLAEAVLSYLGVGCPVGTASWGVMIDGARNELSRDPVVWWNLTAAATALFGLVLALNLLGDSLRRAFDPKRS